MGIAKGGAFLRSSNTTWLLKLNRCRVVLEDLKEPPPSQEWCIEFYTYIIHISIFWQLDKLWPMLPAPTQPTHGCFPRSHCWWSAKNYWMNISQLSRWEQECFSLLLQYENVNLFFQYQVSRREQECFSIMFWYENENLFFQYHLSRRDVGSKVLEKTENF